MTINKSSLLLKYVTLESLILFPCPVCMKIFSIMFLEFPMNGENGYHL